jgi:hypothetical protein
MVRPICTRWALAQAKSLSALVQFPLACGLGFFYLLKCVIVDK